MLFFWAPDEPIPRGGIKQIYRHVEILERAGIEACVLHTQLGFVCTWFEHRAPMAYLGESLPRRVHRWACSRVKRWAPAADLNLHAGRKIKVADASGSYREHRLSSSDVLVMPEYLGASLAAADIELPMAIFNQNVHGTFWGYGFAGNPWETVYSRPNVLGAVVVSEHNRRYLEYAFEGLNVHRVINGVDSALFHPNDSPRYRRIAFMPRKKPQHLEQLINILASRGAFNGWELTPIDGMDEASVAEILRHSFVFLSTCFEEGFGLPPVEAGMAGCLVVGYTGSAADEYFEEGLCERVDQDDILGFAEAIERTLALVETDEAQAVQRGLAFSKLLTERYSLERESESVLAAWRALLDKR